jgi:hypothetical protein
MPCKEGRTSMRPCEWSADVHGRPLFPILPLFSGTAILP